MKKTYCAEDKCEFEVYTKEEVDELLNNKVESDEVYLKSSILNGTSTPSPNLGNDGDLYFKYE